MTPQETIERIELLIGSEKLFIKISTMGEISHSQNIEALEMAKRAIEFRTAKKVERIVSDEDVKLGAMTMKAGTKVFKCTNCNSYVSPSHKFCTECGQALDWSED